MSTLFAQTVFDISYQEGGKKKTHLMNVNYQEDFDKAKKAMAGNIQTDPSMVRGEVVNFSYSADGSANGEWVTINDDAEYKNFLNYLTNIKKSNSNNIKNPLKVHLVICISITLRASN